VRDGDWRVPLLGRARQERLQRGARFHQLDLEVAGHLFDELTAGNEKYIPVEEVKRIRPGGLLTLYRWQGAITLRDGCEVGRWPDGPMSSVTATASSLSTTPGSGCSRSATGDGAALCYPPKS
jgi:hypothetical protein